MFTLNLDFLNSINTDNALAMALFSLNPSEATSPVAFTSNLP